jgi:integrase
MNLFNAFDFVFSVRPGWSPEASSYQQTCINVQHVKDVLGDVPVTSLKPIDVVNLQQEMKRQGKSNGTVNRITSVLSVMMAEMVKHRFLESKVPFSQLKETKGRIVFYTEDEVSSMLAAARCLERESAVTYDIIFVASKTGARKGELSALQWEHIDWEQNTLTFFDTKNGEDRVLPLSDSLRNHLLEMFEQRIDGRVFPIAYPRILTNLKKVQAMCDISDEKNFHTLRHTVATHLFAKGATLPQVKEVMGHKKTEITLRYAHATNEGKLAAMSLL